MLDIKTSRVIYLALFNAAIVIALLGAVILIANNLEHIPGTVFVGVFSALALWLGVTGIREVRHAEPRAESCTASAISRTVARAGNGLTVSGSSEGMIPRSASSRRNCPASR